MKNILKTDYIDESLLTKRQVTEITNARERRQEAFEREVQIRQNQLLDREDRFNDQLAKQIGFDGYDTGAYNYVDELEKRKTEGSQMDATTLERLDMFGARRWDMQEFYDMKAEVKELEKYMAEQKRWLEQQYMNDVLKATYIKMENSYQRKSIGPLMKPEEYNALPEIEKEDINHPMTTIVKGADNQWLDVDNSIAAYISRLASDGIEIGVACSGTVRDYRFVRFDSDDAYGRWKKGELVHQKDERCHACISFPVEKNHPEFVKGVMANADSWGWIAERNEMDGVDSVILRMPHTLDGSSFELIKKEACERAEHHAQLYGIEDVRQAEIEMMEEVEYEHGGRIHYTDYIKQDKWFGLSQNLGKVQDLANKAIRQKNIDEGRAVTVYHYNSEKVSLNADQLADVFRRSRLTLDKDSVHGTLHAWRHRERESFFIATDDGTVRMAAEGEDYPHRLMVKEWQNLSTLMASQIRSITHGGEDAAGVYHVTVMIHPEPKDLETVEKFTIRKNMDQHSYFRCMNENTDANLYLGNLYREELYEAAIDAYENSFSKKLDEIKQQQAVSEIRIRKGIDNNVYISCNVYGERQLAKRMNVSDIEYYRMRMAQSDKAFNAVAPELAQKYYAKEIEAGSLNREQSQGLKR